MKQATFMKGCSILLLSILMISCNQSGSKWTNWDKSFVTIQNLKSTPCMKEELILGRPSQILYIDSSLVICDNKNEYLFLMIDIADHYKTYRFGLKGNAGNEFLQVGSMCRMNTDSVIGIWESYRNQLREINLNRIRRLENEYPVLLKDTTARFREGLHLTKYGAYLGIGFYDEGMLSLSDVASGTHYFFEYPYRDKHEHKISNRLRGMAYQGTLCSNRSLDKFLYAIEDAPIFMLFSVSATKIDKTYEWIANYPIYKTEETEKYFSAPISADNKMAFISAYATDKYIYLLYILDYPITLFCVTDHDETLYALANKGELELVKYDLIRLDVQ